MVSYHLCIKSGPYESNSQHPMLYLNKDNTVPVVLTHGNLYVRSTCMGIRALQCPNEVMVSERRGGEGTKSRGFLGVGVSGRMTRFRAD